MRSFLCKGTLLSLSLGLWLWGSLAPVEAKSWITTRLTNNSYYDTAPQVSGEYIVWAGSDGQDQEIFLYDGTSILQITNNSSNDSSPKNSDSNVVWRGWDGNDWEIFFYNGSSILQLTNNNHEDQYPQISGSNVVWHSTDGNDLEIFLYDGSSVRQITDNSYDDRNPQVSGSRVVWPPGRTGQRRRNSARRAADKEDRQALALVAVAAVR